jgi:hypothetical protein
MKKKISKLKEKITKLDLLEDKCYMCGRVNMLEKHHVFGGNPNRKISDKYGLVVALCSTCHRDGFTGVHASKARRLELQRAIQTEFEKVYSREEFEKIFGRNYL